ncbi:MAG: cytochrome P450 [Aestuariivita sp.]|nr:cytochrome P450 [Aestuariivita sp.]
MNIECMPKEFEDLPGPAGLPVIGHLHRIRLNKLHLVLEEWAEQYGSIFQIRIGRNRVAIISDRPTIQEILRERPAIYRRTSILESVANEINLNGVFTAEDEAWHRQRKFVTTAFDRQNFRAFFPKLMLILNRLKKRWDKAADANEEIDLCHDLMLFTVDATMRFAFGIEANTLETSGPIIQQHLDKVFPMVHRRMNAPFPWWRYIRLPSDRALEKSLAVIEKEIFQIISATRERLNADSRLRKSPENFLEAILVAADTEESGISDAEIFANVGTLLLAGEDTTANSIAWSIYHFLKYPVFFKQAQQEVDGILSLDLVLANIEQTTTLPIIDAVCNETMRHKPVAPILIVQAKQGVEIHGYKISEGTTLILLTRHMAMQEVNFGDAKSFDPTRWLTLKREQKLPHDRRSFAPFGSGPRICPGRNLALLQIRVVLAMLCRNYDLETVRSLNDVAEELAFTMLPLNLPIKLRRRSVSMS